MLRSALIVAAFASLFGCASSQPPPPPQLTSATVASGRLDDAQIATIAGTIARDQRMLARLAINQGDSQAVKNAAARFDAQAPGLVIDVSPRYETSTTNEDLAASDSRLARWLAAHGGSSFDHAFVRAERESIETALGLLDDALIPQADGAQLHASLVIMRRQLAAQLASLDELAGSLR